jgi:tetratricopeptide (TPR) repeat protein
LAAGQPAQAAKAVERARKITNSEWADQLQCALAFAGYDAAGLEAALRHMQTNGSSTFRSKMFLLAACWQAERGHAAQAETLLRDGLRFDLENGQPASTRMAKTLCLAKLYVRLRDFSSAIGCCRNMLRQNPELRLRFETGALLARAGDLKAARTCIPEGLPSTPPAQPPKTLPPGARPELMEWPLYWRRILRLWAEIALAEGRARSAFSLLSACPPGEYHDEWPEALVRASLAAGEHGVAQDWLKKLAGNPGVYWLWTEVLGPGFIREASFWAETAGAGAGHWQPVTRFLKQT